MLKWFLSTLREQHSSRDECGRKKRLKPLNPFLGECFEGVWRNEMDEDNQEGVRSVARRDGKNGLGVTRLVAEQVSHHPPATACRIWNEEHGVSVSPAALHYLDV